MTNSFDKRFIRRFTILVVIVFLVIDIGQCVKIGVISEDETEQLEKVLGKSWNIKMNRLSDWNMIRDREMNEGKEYTVERNLSHTNLLITQDEIKKGLKREQNPLKNIINGLLLISALFITFFGLRVFRLLMMILGFYVCYYSLLIILTETGIYHCDKILHEVLLLIISLMSALAISFLAFYFEKLNFLIFSFSFGTILSMFYLQFFVDNSVDDSLEEFTCLYLISIATTTIFGFLYFDKILIFGSAFIGSIVVCVNFGLIIDDFDSFEERQRIPLHHTVKFGIYCLCVCALFLLGVGFQMYLRNRIIKRFEAEKAKDIRSITIAD